MYATVSDLISYLEHLAKQSGGDPIVCVVPESAQSQNLTKGDLEHYFMYNQDTFKVELFL